MIRVPYAVFASYWGGAEEYVARIVEGVPDDVTATVGVSSPAVRARMTARLAHTRARVIPLAHPVLTRPLDWVRFARDVRAQAPDIVHINLPSTYDRGAGPAAVLARRCGARVVTTEHIASVPVSRRRTMARRVWGGAVSRAITVCDANRRALTARGVAPERIAVVLNGTHVSLRAEDVASGRNAIRAEFDASSSTLFVSVGALTARKRPADIVRAAASLAHGGARRFVVALVGEGDERDSLAALVRDSGAPVRLCGSRTDVDDLLDAADAVVVASEREGLPFVVLEAMARGCAVIATDVDGIPEAVAHEETGLLVPVGDVPALARAMKRVIDAPDERARWRPVIAQRARARFDVARMVRETVDVYRAVAVVP